MCFWRGGLRQRGGGQRGRGYRRRSFTAKKKKKKPSQVFLLAKTKRGTESAKFVKEAEKVQKSSIKEAGERPVNFEQRAEKGP